MASLPSLDQLKRAVHVAEQLQRLETELAGLLGSAGSIGAVTAAAVHHETSAVSKRGRGRPAGRRNSDTTVKLKKAAGGRTGRRELSPEGKARIAEAARRRWEEYRKNKA